MRGNVGAAAGRIRRSAQPYLVGAAMYNTHSPHTGTRTRTRAWQHRQRHCNLRVTAKGETGKKGDGLTDLGKVINAVRLWG